MSGTEIEWTDATWNPVAGCSIHSAGCTNCYAMNMARRLEAMGVEKYSNLTRKSGKRTVWTGDVRLDYSSLKAPLAWKRPRKIFVNSMSDLFHDKVPFSFIRQVWDVMKVASSHSFQILTKRPDRMAEFTQKLEFEALPNVWLGTSIEDFSTVHRADDLRRVDSAVRFVSFEPLIGPVGRIDLSSIHWAIVGGESGAGARPIKEAWIDEIHDQCAQQNVAFFFKQWGAWGADNKRRSKKANGREYRGAIWSEMPNQLSL